MQYKDIGYFDKAEEAYDESLRISRRLDGDRLVLADALLGMGDLLDASADYDGAMECYVECIQIQKSSLGNSHDDIARSLSTGIGILD